MPASATATARENLRATRIIGRAMIIGVSFFALVILLLNIFQTGAILDPAETAKSQLFFLIMAGVMGLFCFYIAFTGYQKKIAEIREMSGTLSDKINVYRATLVRYMALCEAPAILGIIIFFLTGNFIFFSITGLMLAAMLWKSPGEKRIIAELNLDWKEQQELSK